MFPHFLTSYLQLCFMTCNSDKLEASDKLHKVGICNNKNIGDMHYIEKRVGRDEEFIILLGIKRHSIAACCLFCCACGFIKFPC